MQHTTPACLSNKTEDVTGGLVYVFSLTEAISPFFLAYVNGIS